MFVLLWERRSPEVWCRWFDRSAGRNYGFISLLRQFTSVWMISDTFISFYFFRINITKYATGTKLNCVPTRGLNSDSGRTSFREGGGGAGGQWATFHWAGPMRQVRAGLTLLTNKDKGIKSRIIIQIFKMRTGLGKLLYYYKYWSL